MSDTSGSWFRKSIVYQVYPLSFQDSGNDGIGDLKGITSRLPYLADLGITAIWICPFYPSPMCDHGYDIKDFTDVDPRFGTLADFDQLVAEAHKVGIKILIDFVSNHTSKEHPWFISSRSSRNSPHRDWYIWRDPKTGGGPPNNWLSVLDNSAWTLDEETGQYYLHQFLDAQPDLNWRNPEVVKAMTDVMRFWLDRNTDGFRIDAISHLLEDEKFRNDTFKKTVHPHAHNSHDASKTGRFTYQNYVHNHSIDNPALAAIIRQFNDVAEEYQDRFIICETYSSNRIIAPMYASAGNAIAPFNFKLLGTRCTPRSIHDAVTFYARPAISKVQTSVLSNHDQPRIASRWPRPAAPMAALLQFTLGGTPFMYYGDEIGMESLPVGVVHPDKALAKLIPTIDGFNAATDADNPWRRHRSRLPMQWSIKKGHGFTDGDPWICPERAILPEETADGQKDAPQSLLNFYRILIKLWKQHELYDVHPQPVVASHTSSKRTVDACVAYDLMKNDQCIGTVLLNPSDSMVDIPVSVYKRAIPSAPYTVFGTHHRKPVTSDAFPIEKSHMLEAYEGILILYSK